MLCWGGQTTGPGLHSGPRYCLEKFELGKGQAAIRKQSKTNAVSVLSEPVKQAGKHRGQRAWDSHGRQLQAALEARCFPPAVTQVSESQEPQGERKEGQHEPVISVITSTTTFCLLIHLSVREFYSRSLSVGKLT